MRGVELFNSGLYWDAHEVWEEEWKPQRKEAGSDFYKGLIQVAAGCLHYRRHNRRGAVNKWTSGTTYLRPFVPSHMGVHVATLVSEVEACLSQMTADEWPELDMPRIGVD